MSITGKEYAADLSKELADWAEWLRGEGMQNGAILASRACCTILGLISEREDLERQRAVWQEHFDHMAMQIAELERQRDEACSELKVIRSVFDTAGEIPRSAYFAEARNAALEEAAMLAVDHDYWALADRIRALKDKQP
jgi:hypothetical protein